MPLLLGAEMALQVLCLIHALRTGRDRLWVYVIILLPAVGVVAYALCELLPELIGPRRAQEAADAARRLMDPDKPYREAERAFELAPTPHNRRRLADACAERSDFAGAAGHYRALLTGYDAADPELMRVLARALFANGDPTGALATLDELRRLNPDYRSGEAHLLYARALERLGRLDEAIGEYRALADYYGGEEPRGRLAALLERRGRDAEAAMVRAQILRSARLAPKHYVDANRPWIDAAQQASARGSSPSRG